MIIVSLVDDNFGNLLRVISINYPSGHCSIYLEKVK